MEKFVSKFCEIGLILTPVVLIGVILFLYHTMSQENCQLKIRLLEAGDDLYQDAATDKQWKEYINKKYHFDPPVCSSYSEN
jgi:uncharacterized membrane protein